LDERDGHKGKPTLRDVAREAKVSMAVASRALNLDNRSGPVNRVKKDSVLAAADTLHYVPPSSSRVRLTKTIGVVVPNLIHPHFARVVSCIVQRARAQQVPFRVLIASSTDGGRVFERESVRLLLKGRVDGIIAIPGCGPRSEVVWRRVLERDVPVVFVDEDLTTRVPGADSVVIDNRRAGRDVAWHLFKNGHKRIGWLAGPLDLPSYAARVDAYREAYQEYRKGPKGPQLGLLELDEALIRPFQLTEIACVKEVNTLLDAVSKKVTVPGDPKVQRVTAIIANDNWIGQCLLAASAARKLAVPNHLSLITIGDVPWMSELKAQPTTVTHSPEKLAEAAVTRLMDLIEHPKDIDVAVDETGRSHSEIVEGGGVVNVRSSVYDRDSMGHLLAPDDQ
jgi:LacI family transcriptional regulator, galactose operon repressor